MRDASWNIGPRSIRRRVAMLIAVLGVAWVGSRLASVWPRDVEVAFQVGPDVTKLDADYVLAGDAVASVRFARPRPNLPGFRHVVRLRPGEYQVHITLHGRDGSAVETFRTLAVPTRGLTRVDLRGALRSSE